MFAFVKYCCVTGVLIQLHFISSYEVHESDQSGWIPISGNRIPRHMSGGISLRHQANVAVVENRGEIGNLFTPTERSGAGRDKVTSVEISKARVSVLPQSPTSFFPLISYSGHATNKSDATAYYAGPNDSNGDGTKVDAGFDENGQTPKDLNGVLHFDEAGIKNVYENPENNEIKAKVGRKRESGPMKTTITTVFGAKMNKYNSLNDNLNFRINNGLNTYLEPNKINFKDTYAIPDNAILVNFNNILKKYNLDMKEHFENYKISRSKLNYRNDIERGYTYGSHKNSVSEQIEVDPFLVYLLSHYGHILHHLYRKDPVARYAVPGNINPPSKFGLYSSKIYKTL